MAIACVIGIMCSCSKDRESYVANVGDGETTPTMLTIDVRTFVSDSGYTRYYITTPIWAMYDEAEEPKWKFPDTLMLEQYDRDMNITSTMRCDSATYLTQKRLWRLDGNVRMVNSMGDSFATQQVFWDQSKREVYSDSFIHIVRTDRIIEGFGFTSNEPMTEYTVNLPTGIFPATRVTGQEAQEPTDSASESTEARHRRPSSRPTSKMGINKKAQDNDYDSLAETPKIEE